MVFQHLSTDECLTVLTSVELISLLLEDSLCQWVRKVDSSCPWYWDIIRLSFTFQENICEWLYTLNMCTSNTTRGSAIAEEPRNALRHLKYYGRFLTELLTRSSANAEEPCEHTVSWNCVQCCTNVRRIACENVCNRWMTFKVIQGHCRCHHLIGHILFPITLPL